MDYCLALELYASCALFENTHLVIAFLCSCLDSGWSIRSRLASWLSLLCHALLPVSSLSPPVPVVLYFIPFVVSRLAVYATK